MHCGQSRRSGRNAAAMRKSANDLLARTDSFNEMHADGVLI
jgi:hypothetical protein